MTPKPHAVNFQQGWLDLLRRHGFAVAIAAFLIWQTNGRFAGQIDKLVDGMQAHVVASAETTKEQAAMAAAVEKAAEQDRAQMQKAIGILRLICIHDAHNDTQRAECLK